MGSKPTHFVDRILFLKIVKKRLFGSYWILLGNFAATKNHVIEKMRPDQTEE